MCKSLVSCFFDSQYSCVWNRRVLADCWIYFSERFISKHAVNWSLEDPVASRTRFALLSCEMLTSNISDNLHYVRVLEIWWTVTYFYKDMPTVELTTKELRKSMARMPNGVPELPPVGSLHDDSLPPVALSSQFDRTAACDITEVNGRTHDHCIACLV